MVRMIPLTQFSTVGRGLYGFISAFDCHAPTTFSISRVHEVPHKSMNDYQKDPGNRKDRRDDKRSKRFGSTISDEKHLGGVEVRREGYHAVAALCLASGQ